MNIYFHRLNIFAVNGRVHQNSNLWNFFWRKKENPQCRARCESTHTSAIYLRGMEHREYVSFLICRSFLTCVFFSHCYWKLGEYTNIDTYYMLNPHFRLLRDSFRLALPRTLIRLTFRCVCVFFVVAVAVLFYSTHLPYTLYIFFYLYNSTAVCITPAAEWILHVCTRIKTTLMRTNSTPMLINCVSYGRYICIIRRKQQQKKRFLSRKNTKNKVHTYGDIQRKQMYFSFFRLSHGK